MAPEQTTFIPVNVITGFLGSGKTTLLQRLLAAPQLADTAVLVNEFGEVGLDHHLLQRVDDEIVLLKSGCLCCTIRGDLSAAMRGLYAKRERSLPPPCNRDHGPGRSRTDTLHRNDRTGASSPFSSWQRRHDGRRGKWFNESGAPTGISEAGSRGRSPCDHQDRHCRRHGNTRAIQETGEAQSFRLAIGNRSKCRYRSGPTSHPRSP